MVGPLHVLPGRCRPRYSVRVQLCLFLHVSHCVHPSTTMCELSWNHWTKWEELPPQPSDSASPSFCHSALFSLFARARDRVKVISILSHTAYIALIATLLTIIIIENSTPPASIVQVSSEHGTRQDFLLALDIDTD